MESQSGSRARKPPTILRPYLAVDKPNAEGEWAMFCPFHEGDSRDHDPSASINPAKRVWKCFAECGHGSIKGLLERLERDGPGEKAADGTVIDFESEKRRRRPGSKTEPSVQINMGMVEGWVGALKTNTKAIEDFMFKRGLSETTIEKFLIGFDRARQAYTIPVFDRNGELLNVRYYRPNKHPRYQNTSGYGDVTLYPWSILNEDHKGLVICEGELDALTLIQRGIPAISGTGGAGTWNEAWNLAFKGLQVYICYDRDKRGRDGAQKVAHNLRKVAKSIRIVELPFPFKNDHGEDITDFFVQYGKSVDEFRELLKKSERIGQPKKKEAAKPIRVLDSFSGALVGKPLEMRATVVGRSNPTHIVPKYVIYDCSQDAGDKCAACPMNVHGGHMETTVSPSDPHILQFMNINDDQKDTVVRRLLGIVKCTKMTYEVTDNWTVETLIVRSSIDHTAEEASDHTQRRVLAVGPHDTLPGETVRFVGTTIPNPKDQYNEFQAWESDKDRASFDAFTMTDAMKEQLGIFMPEVDQKPLWKLKDIAEDLAETVTFIYGRPELHIAMDLVWHSVIGFTFLGRSADKGWLDVLVLGDTRTGKSETAAALLDYYGLGTMLSCESATFAGVFAAVTQKAGKEWTITWGAIPINDRRLVVLDEVAGLRVEEISQLSSVRSSGIAKITKVEQAEARARTRLIWLANPRDGRQINDFGYGARAIKPLIGNNEDIARFDFAMVVSNEEVDLDVINRSPVRRAPKYPQEACRNLVRWAWSRKPDQVGFEQSSVAYIREASKRLVTDYTESLPLIQGANVRLKLARIAAAIAVRLFSSDETGERVVVRGEHAKAAVAFLDHLYASPKFGYKQLSRAQLQALQEGDSVRGDVKQYLSREPQLLRFLYEIEDGEFSHYQLQSNIGVEPAYSNSWIKFLQERNMLGPGKTPNVRMKPILQEIVRELMENG